MKLLVKSEVIKAKSIDRQREIDEGLKLSGKVDALREISAQEEAKFAKFRTETLSVIQSEILSETKKRDELKHEVSVLEDRKVQALKPLTEELDKITAGKEHLIGIKSALDLRDTNIKDKELELSNREQKVIKLEREVSYAQSDVSTRLQNAGTLESNAERMNRVATETLENAKVGATEILSNAAQREVLVTEREKASSIKEEELRTKAIDLANEFIRLKDREATLARNINRLK